MQKSFLFITKRGILLLLVLVLMAMILPVATTSAATVDTTKVDGFTCTVNSGQVTITDYTGTAATVSIPATIGEFPVTTIGAKAFNGCETLTSVTIPNSVITIGDMAFRDCEKLTCVTIPDSVMFVGDYAFRGCLALSEITISDSVTFIGEGAFLYCAGVSEVTIPNSVTTIGEKAFGYQYDSKTKTAVLSPAFTMRGYADSAAETYCKANGISFAVITVVEGTPSFLERYGLWIMIGGGVLLVVIALLGLLLILRVKKKKKATPDRAPADAAPTKEISVSDKPVSTVSAEKNSTPPTVAEKIPTPPNPAPTRSFDTLKPRFCPACGAPLSANGTFCGKCGHRLS